MIEQLCMIFRNKLIGETTEYILKKILFSVRLNYFK